MVEWAKAPSLDRGVVPGRRARQLWLQPARWLGCPVCACQQPAGVRKRGSWAAVGLGEAWLCGCGGCCHGSSECRLCCLPQAHCHTNVSFPELPAEAKRQVSKKSKIGCLAIRFLGFVVGLNLHCGEPERVHAMALVPEPKNKKAVRRCVGGTGFYSELVHF